MKIKLGGYVRHTVVENDRYAMPVHSAELLLYSAGNPIPGGITLPLSLEQFGELPVGMQLDIAIEITPSVKTNENPVR